MKDSSIHRIAAIAKASPALLTPKDIKSLAAHVLGALGVTAKRRKRRTKRKARKATTKTGKKKMSKKLEAAVLAQLKKEVKAGRIKPKRTKANVEHGIVPN